MATYTVSTFKDIQPKTTKEAAEVECTALAKSGPFSGGIRNAFVACMAGKGWKVTWE